VERIHSWWLGVATLLVALACCRSAPAAAEASDKPATTTLPSITVTAKQSAVQTLVDRKVYSVTTDLQSASGTAADVLNKVPSVDVSPDGNVTLRGNGNVTILIDGKPSALFSGPQAGDGLLQMAAHDIDSVEVMTSPPAQFKAEGTGIINIVTRKNRRPGASGTLQASGGNYNRYLLGASGSYNAGALSLSGGVNLRRDTRTQSLQSSLLAINAASQTAVTSSEDLYTATHRLIPAVTGGVGYKFNERQSLLFSFSDRERSGHSSSDQYDQSRTTNGALLTASSRHSDNDESGREVWQALSFSQVLRHPEETLDLAFNRSAYTSRQFLPFQTTYALPPQPPGYQDLSFFIRLASNEFSADYKLALPRGRKLRLGYDLEFDRDAFDNGGNTLNPASGLLLPDPTVTNFFRYHQTVNAAYMSYQAGFANWTLLAGARAERTSIDTLQVIGNVLDARSYTHMYPSLHVTRILSPESTLNLGITRRVSRPPADALNPFVDTQVTHNLRAGNPDLLPQDTRSFELGYNFDSDTLQFALTAYLRRERNGFTDVTRLVSDDVLLTTRANLPRSQSEGLEFNFNGHLTPTLSYRISGNLYHNQIDASALGIAELQSTTGVNGKLSIDYRPTMADSAQLWFTHSDRRLTPQGFVSGTNQVNVGYKRQVDRALSVTVTITDLFNGQHFTRVTATPLLVNSFRREFVGRIAFVGVVYQLGAATRNKPAGFEYEQ
jgi:outer membrane receptor protein involved in Fe transport